MFDVASGESLRGGRGVLALGFLLLAACATTSGGPPSKVHTTPAGAEQRFSMVGSGFQTTALITADGAQGPQIDVGRYEDGKAIRGTVNGRTIDLTVKEDSASGIWGQGPLTINLVAGAPEELKATGLVAGRPSNFTATKEKITGQIGLCGYELNRTGDDYTGSRSCAGGIGQVTVDFPSSILTWKPINIAVLMALLMSSP